MNNATGKCWTRIWYITLRASHDFLISNLSVYLSMHLSAYICQAICYLFVYFIIKSSPWGPPWLSPQVLLCFFRDTEVLSHFEHSSASPPLAVARGNTPSPNALVAYPPCGVIPFHGFTMYGTSSLYETFDRFLSLIFFSLDFIMYGMSFLRVWDSLSWVLFTSTSS